MTHFSQLLLDRKRASDVRRPNPHQLPDLIGVLSRPNTALLEIRFTLVERCLELAHGRQLHCLRRGKYIREEREAKVIIDQKHRLQFLPFSGGYTFMHAHEQEMQFPWRGGIYTYSTAVLRSQNVNQGAVTRQQTQKQMPGGMPD